MWRKESRYGLFVLEFLQKNKATYLFYMPCVVSIRCRGHSSQEDVSTQKYNDTQDDEGSKVELHEMDECAPVMIYKNISDVLQCPWNENGYIGKWHLARRREEFCVHCITMR